MLALTWSLWLGGVMTLKENQNIYVVILIQHPVYIKSHATGIVQGAQFYWYRLYEPPALGISSPTVLLVKGALNTVQIESHRFSGCMSPNTGCTKSDCLTGYMGPQLGIISPFHW